MNNEQYCIKNSIGQYLTEDGIWVDLLQVNCCFSALTARELVYIHDLYNVEIINIENEQ